MEPAIHQTFIWIPQTLNFPPAVKGKIAQLVESQFGLDLEISKKGDQLEKSGVTTIDKVRNNAFRLARQVLIQGKAVSYAEQFQGMYALTRGLLAVFALACAYWLGWFFATERSAGLRRTAIVLVGVAIPVLLGIHLLRDKVSQKETKHKLEIAYACVLIIMFLAVGYVAGVRCYVSWGKSGVLAFMVICALIACFRFKSAYENFAGLFASTVWRDYLAYNVQSGNCPKPLAGEE